MLKVKVVLAPGATFDERFTRFNPQVVLSCGFCEPKKYEPANHVAVPVFLIVTETVAVCPACIDAGTFCETKAELFATVPAPVVAEASLE
jgi:hypothetical protein